MPEGAASRSQDAGPQPDRDGHDGTGAEESSGRRQSLLFGRADETVFDVTAHPLAQQWRQRPVPLTEDGGQITAVPSSGPGDEGGAERTAGGRPGPDEHLVGAGGGHTQRAGDLVGREPLPVGQIEHEPIARRETTHGVVDHRRQVGVERAAGGRVGLRTGVDGDVLGRDDPTVPLDPGQTGMPSHGKQPATQPVRLAQPAQPGGGHDEDVLQAVVGVGLVADDRPAERQ
jgi:hypothetical protein